MATGRTAAEQKESRHGISRTQAACHYWLSGTESWDSRSAGSVRNVVLALGFNESLVDHSIRGRIHIQASEKCQRDATCSE